MTGFIPASEGRFSAWANNFVNTLDASPESFGLTAEAVTVLKERGSQWDSSYQESVSKHDAAKAATVAKKLSRNEFEELIRELSKQIQSNPTVSEESRRDAGLPIHKTTRTPHPVPTTVPVVQIDKSELLAVVISWTDSSTPTRRGKPNGVVGCQIYVAVADVVPHNPDDYRFVTQSTKAPSRITFRPEDGGKTAHFLLRWVNTRGEAGPWSTVISSTVPCV